MNISDEGLCELFKKNKDGVAIEPDDIQQGNLPDCYFLAVLSSLAEREDRIKNMFIK
jgi:hypothetical protein